MVGITVFILSILFTLRWGHLVDEVNERNKQILKSTTRKYDGDK
jgi:hypothetical protein